MIFSLNRAAVAAFTIFALLAPAGSAAEESVVPGAATVDVTRATLDNGLRVVIVRDPLAPVVSVYDNYLVGADETPDGFPGMAHAQEHMAFRGCTGVSADQTSALFAQLGGDGDADTQQNVTQYFETVPAADLDVALNLDAACMRGIDDSQSEWKQERGAIEQEVARDLSNPTYNAFERLIGDIFAGTPYGHDALGTRPSFDKTTGALLREFHDDWYAPNNAILVIAGDVEPQRTLALVRGLYGSIPSRKIAARPEINLSPVKAESYNLDSDLPYALSFTGYRTPGSGDRDFAATKVLFDVLGSQRADVYALGPAGKALQAGAQIVASYPKAGVGIVYGALAPGSDVTAFNATLAGIVAGYAAKGVPDDSSLRRNGKRSRPRSSTAIRSTISPRRGRRRSRTRVASHPMKTSRRLPPLRQPT